MSDSLFVVLKFFAGRYDPSSDDEEAAVPVVDCCRVSCMRSNVVDCQNDSNDNIIKNNCYQHSPERNIKQHASAVHRVLLFCICSELLIDFNINIRMLKSARDWPWSLK